MRRERLNIQLAKLLDAYLGRLMWILVWLRIIPPRPPISSNTRKILFIKFWGMGSIILSEPALRWLRKKYPEAEIHYLTLEQNRDLLAMIPAVDRVHCLPFRGPLGFLFQSIVLMRQLRRERYSLVFDAEFFVHYSALLACLVKGERIIGFTRTRSVKERLFDVRVPFRNHLHTSEQFLRLVQKDLGAGPTPFPRLLLPQGNQSSPWHRAKDHRPYVVLNINAGPLALERRWPRERFAELAAALLKSYSYDLVLVGSKPERRYVAPLQEALLFPSRVRNYTGKLNLLELAHLIRRALLMISNDSGPLHMAAALGVPVVGFYGPETPATYGPVSRRKLVFYSDLWCSPCMSLDKAKTVTCINDLACMKHIESQYVIRRVFEFIDVEVVEHEGAAAVAASR